MKSLPVKYRGNETVIFYFSAYKPRRYIVGIFNSENTIVWESTVIDGGGRIIEKVEYVNDLFRNDLSVYVKNLLDKRKKKILKLELSDVIDSLSQQ